MNPEETEQGIINIVDYEQTCISNFKLRFIRKIYITLVIQFTTFLGVVSITFIPAVQESFFMEKVMGMLIKLQILL